MNIGSTTIHKNDSYFRGDVVLATEDYANGWVSVKVLIIPNGNDARRYGMEWELDIRKGDLRTNVEVLAEIKTEWYETQGESEPIKVYEEDSE